jgi:pilus assembly protein CpaB
MSRRRLILISLVLGLLGIILLQEYISQLQQRYKVSGRYVPVYVASKYIPPYTVIKEDMLSVVEVPQQYLQPAALTPEKKLRTAQGSYVYSSVVPILQNEQVTLTKLCYVGSEGTLSLALPPGKRAYTLLVDENNAISGLIRPGDYVDILLTIDYSSRKSGTVATKTFTLLQKVLVIACGKEILTPEKKAAKAASSAATEESTPTSLTFALSIDEIQKLIMATYKGRINVVLRPAGDEEVYLGPPYSFSELIEEPGAVAIVEPKSDVANILRRIEEQVKKQIQKQRAESSQE